MVEISAEISARHVLLMLPADWLMPVIKQEARLFLPEGRSIDTG